MVIEGLNIQGMVTINANDVTLKNCKVTSGSWAVINITSGKTGVVIQDCEINGMSAEGVRGISGQGTFLRNEIIIPRTASTSRAPIPSSRTTISTICSQIGAARTMMESRQTAGSPTSLSVTTRSLTLMAKHPR